MLYRTIRYSTFILLVCALWIALPAQAQWSNDPANNLLIADQPLAQSQSQIVPTPDGGFYVAWLRDFAESDVYLQKLDAAGNEVLAHNGILAIDRTFSGNGSFALASDADGNAILVGECCDSGDASNHIAVFKFAPDGSALFGPNGITVSSTNPVFGGSVAVTSDGNVVALWKDGAGIQAKKLDAAGNPLWGVNGVTIPVPNANTFFGSVQVVASDAGSVIAAFDSSNFTLPSGGNQVLAQKLAGGDGAALWGAQPVAVSLPVDGVFDEPALDADSSGGAVLAWSEQYDPVTFAYTVKAQHLDANGAPLLAIGGIETATTANRTRFFEQVFFDAGAGDMYVMWQEQDATAPSQGVFAQRIDAGGVLQFGSTGKLLTAYDAVGKQDSNLLPAPGGMLAQWVVGDFGTPRIIRAARLDNQGNFTFPGNIVDIKTAPTNVNRVAAALGTHGYAAYTWAEDALGEFEEDIYGQNIQLDGTLGGSGDLIFANGFD